MKHTLQAKYAANGITAYRQRILASVPAEVARMTEVARRQEIVDRVTARLDAPTPIVYPGDDVADAMRYAFQNMSASRSGKSIAIRSWAYRPILSVMNDVC